MTRGDALDAAMGAVMPDLSDVKDESEPKFDMLQMYFGIPVKVKSAVGDKELELIQPTVGDIARVGEERFYRTASIFFANTTMYRLPLWNMGLDWNVVSDFELFIMRLPTADDEIVKMLLRGIELSECGVLSTEEHKPRYIADEKHGIVIDEGVYETLAKYFRTLLGVDPKVEKTESRAGKESIIEEEMISAYYDSKKDRPHSTLVSLISACVNHPGFKYKSRELMDVGIFEFMDSVKRLQIYESATAALKGMYGGFIDTKKMKAETFDFMRPAS